MQLESALLAWVDVLGVEHVQYDADVLELYARSTWSQPVPALAVIRPADHEEVVAAVKIAARFKVPIYPISRGRSWGYGDRCPVTPGNVILDLGRLDRILEVNSELAYAVVEPGVTQGQLSRFLRERGIPLWPDCTGAGPDTSIVGNVLDRGFGHTLYGNRSNHISGIDVVLADGQVLRTGFGHYQSSRVTYLFPYGIGPSLDGLFVQSGMGIVTRMGLWLMPEPEAFSLLVCSLDDHEDIGPFVDQLRRLRLDGTLRSVLHIGNDLRMISSGMSFPRDLFGEGMALPPEFRKQLRRQGGLGAWTIAGGIYGTKSQVRSARREVRRGLAGANRRLQFFDDRSLRLAASVLKPFTTFSRVADLYRKIGALRSVFDMNRGIPSSRFLAGSYWKHRAGLPEDFSAADPARDGCGFYWLPPVLPFTGAAVREFLGLVEPVFERHGFDFFVTFSTVTERALSAVMTIAYDKDSERETQAARACYEELLGILLSSGFPPYRSGPLFAALQGDDHDAYWKTVSRIRQCLDADRLIAPGRYDPLH